MNIKLMNVMMRIDVNIIIKFCHGNMMNNSNHYYNNFKLKELVGAKTSIKRRNLMIIMKNINMIMMIWRCQDEGLYRIEVSEVMV
jgi:hypothetical protein